MKYIELKNALKSKIENNYLICGEDRFLCYDSLKKIESSLNILIKDMNTVTLSGEQVSAREIVDSANIYPFGDLYRLIIVKNFNPSKNKDEASIIQKYLDSPMLSTVIVFFNPDSADFFKGMKNLETIDCSKIDDKTIALFIKNYLAKEGVSSNENVVNKLIMLTNGDMTRITGELQKLCAYVLDTKVLTEEIVDDFVVQDKEYQVFEFANFLAKNDINEAINLIDSFSNKGSAFQMLAPLYNNYRRALYVSINKDKTPAEIASLLGVKEFAVKMLKSQTEVFNPKQLKQIVDMIADYDRKIKVGEMKESNAIKMIVFNILNIRGINGR